MEHKNIAPGIIEIQGAIPPECDDYVRLIQGLLHGVSAPVKIGVAYKLMGEVVCETAPDLASATKNFDAIMRSLQTEAPTAWEVFQNERDENVGS